MPYQFKRQAIQSCLYGVDIDPGAVEIAKLRLWLSLVVDEEEREKIQPLPNLDYKIVQGNSLLSIEKGEIINSVRFKKLEELKPLFFNETNINKKKKYRNQINEIISQITKDRKDFDFEVYFSEVFHENNGFDVVIANPPYVKEYVNRAAFDGIRNSPYYKGKMDLWHLFACKGIDLLKLNGILTFIAQNNWVTNSGASKVRNKVIQNTQILSLIDFGACKIFDAGIQTMVMTFQKNTDRESYTFDYRRLLTNDLTIDNVIALLNKEAGTKAEYFMPKVLRTEFIGKVLTFNPSNINNVLSKIHSHANFKLDAKTEMAQGIVPNPDAVGASNIKKISKSKLSQYGINKGDGVFVTPKYFFKGLNSYERKLLKPLYEPSDLARYFIRNNNSKEIIYSTKASGDVKQMPVLLDHLKKYKEIMERRRENKNGRINFYHLHWPRDEHFFETGAKILAVRKCVRPTFAYTENPAYVMMSINIIKTSRLSLKYLLGVLSSRLIEFCLKFNGKMQGTNFQMDKEPLLNLPLVKPNQKEQDDVASLVERILAITKVDHYLDKVAMQSKVNEYEKQIDQLVYKLYGLTAKEIRIVEANVTES